MVTGKLASLLLRPLELYLEDAQIKRARHHTVEDISRLKTDGTDKKKFYVQLPVPIVTS